MNEIEKKFDLIIPEKKDAIAVMQDDINGDAAIKDFTQARASVVGILQIGSDAINELGRVAMNAQQPEHYVALSGMIKNVADVSSILLKLHKQLEELKNQEGNKRVEKYENHVHFHGSTAELAAGLKTLKKE